MPSKARAGLAWLASCAIACSAPPAGSDAGPSDSGSAVDAGSLPDAGPTDAGGPADAGIRYTPYSCADAGFGSPFDRTESFLGTDGGTIVITICGPRPGSSAISVIPIDGGSSAAELATAGAQAADAGAGTLTLAPGVYDFSSVDGGPNWTIAGASDLLIDGQGSTVLFHGSGSGLVISNGQRVLLRNLTLDWAGPLNVSGSLDAASPSCDGGLAFTVDPTFSVDPAAPLPITVISQFDVSRPGWPLAPFQQAHWVQTPKLAPTYGGGQTYCIGTPQLLASVPSGTPAIGIARNNLGNALVVSRSANVALENVTVYASPTEAITIIGGGPGFRVSDCHVLRKPNDPTRLISSNADGINFRQTLGSILLEDSEFADQGDDGVSIVGQFFNVDPNSTPTALALSPAFAFPDVQVGDTLVVVDAATFAPLGSAVAAQVTPIRDGGVLLGASVALTAPGITGLPDAGLLATVPARSSPNFLIRNVSLHDNDQRGMLIHGVNGLVDGATLENDLGMILMAQDNFFLEGPGASNVTVQNSVFRNCDFMAPSLSAWSCVNLGAAPPAPLSIQTMTFDAAFPRDFPNTDIALKNNLIDGAPGIGVLVASATGVQVSGNIVLNANQTALDAGVCGRFAPLPSASMAALQATGVRFSQNQRDGGSLGLVIDPSCQGCVTQPGY